MDNQYGFGKTVSYPFHLAIEKVISALQKEGFGVLTEIDVAATMKNKLNIDSPPYKILGACNPTLAYDVLQADPSMGLLLPCNVVVRTTSDNNVRIEFMDPKVFSNITQNKTVERISLEAKRRLQSVMNSL